MQFEKLKKDNHKKIIIGGLILVGILSTLILTTTRAKYKTTQSINIVNGTINYKPYDFKILAMYKQKEGSTCTEDSCYEEITGRMPTNGYAINEDKSYCTLDGTNRDTEAVLKTINGIHSISNLAKNEKCKLYFDKQICIGSACKTVLAGITVKETEPDYSNAATTDEGVYKIADGMYGGYSYVFRGAVKNNWIKFGGFYWRIIRFNGDETIRMIYNGTSTATTGEGTQISTSYYNSNDDRSESVGYTYKTGYQRPTATTKGTETLSTIKEIVDTWYSDNIGKYATTLLSKVADGKYCNDRSMVSGYTWASKPSTTFYYAARERLETNKTPTLSCSNSGDIYTLKAGLITIDEASMAGGVDGTNNSNYYLYTKQAYWTMSPYSYDSSYTVPARVFYVYSNGQLNGNRMNYSFGVRPVINLKADTQFQPGGNGTSSNPYVVS